MTNPAETPAVVAGWYADYEDARRLRWWDGTQWTEHVSDPAAPQYVAIARNTVPSTTPVYNVFIWVIVLLPILSILLLLTLDFRGIALSSLPGGTASSLAIYSNPAYLASQFGSFVLYGVTVLLAFFDWRKLGRDGFERPFFWAWAFLSGTVYVIGRSVVAHRRSGRGYLVLWVFIAIIALSFIVSIVEVSQMMSVIYANLPAIPTS